MPRLVSLRNIAFFEIDAKCPRRLTGKHSNEYSHYVILLATKYEKFSDEDWIVHLDEETLLSLNAVYT